MAYSDLVVKKALDRLSSAKKEKEAIYQEHLDQAYARLPRLHEIDLQLRSIAAEAVSKAISRGEDPALAIDALREKSLSLQNERQWLLDDAGFEDDYLDDAPICELCGGSGYVGAKMCECLRELCRQEQKRELTSLLNTGKETFDNFSLDYYPETFDPSISTSPRRMMHHNLTVCKKYAQEFSASSGNLLFSGNTGLGKTFLSGCIARIVADNGFSVVYETVSKVFSDFEAVKLGRMDASVLDKYLNCDLFILDDLGTEITTPFSISALYTIVNSRLLAGKAVIISTNIAPDKLEARYSPQIASRILGNYQLIPFVGKDIRLMK